MQIFEITIKPRKRKNDTTFESEINEDWMRKVKQQIIKYFINFLQNTVFLSLHVCSLIYEDGSSFDSFL